VETVAFIGCILTPVSFGFSAMASKLVVGIMQGSVERAYSSLLRGFERAEKAIKSHVVKMEGRWAEFKRQLFTVTLLKVEFNVGTQAERRVGTAVDIWHKMSPIVFQAHIPEGVAGIDPVITTAPTPAPVGANRVAPAAAPTTSSAEARLAAVFAKPRAVLHFVGMGLSVSHIVVGAMERKKQAGSVPPERSIRQLVGEMQEVIKEIREAENMQMMIEETLETGNL
jgi:hypothetical protein